MSCGIVASPVVMVRLVDRVYPLVEYLRILEDRVNFWKGITSYKEKINDIKNSGYC